MPDDIINQELSLDDIFSRGRKEAELKSRKSKQPFKFLDSYTREDKSIFFGRESETDEIFRKFYSGKLLLVYGKSGTGKSSIINCGLISRIPEEDLFAINIRCGKKANENFITEIRKYSSSSSEKPVDILEDVFYEYSKPVALIFDQFEEIFILSDEEERVQLAKALNEILKSRLKINIVLVIREEYFASLTEFEPFIPDLYRNRIRIERMNRSAARDAIVKPCRECNVGIEEGLPDKIIEQLIWQSEGLELTWLQILMDKLYKTAASRDQANPLIKNEDLENLGRIGNVLSDFLDEQLRLMPHGDLGENLLKTMVSTDGTKKQLTIREISDALISTGHSSDVRVIEEILRHFIDVRIVTDRDEQGFYELRHDAIAWRIYERMSATEKEIVEVKAFLENSFKIYKQRKALLTENDLKYIALYENKLILGEELKNFIKVSRKEAQKARLRRRYITVGALALLILILSGFSLWAFIERTNAIRQTKIAEEQKNEAVKANMEAESARLRAQEGENRAKENEAKAFEQRKIAEEQRQVALKANREAEDSRKQALEEKNRAVENEKLAVVAKQDAEKAKNDVMRASSQAQFYLYQFNGKELAGKSLAMQENDTLRALLALSASDLVTYGHENFSHEYSIIKYDGEILKSLQKSYSLFEKDSLVGGEVWAIASKDKKIVYSNRIGQLIIAQLEDKNPADLPILTSVASVNLPVNSLVRAVAFDPGADRLACGTIDGSVMLFKNFTSAPQVSEIIYNHKNNRVLSLAFIPEREWLVSSSTDKTIRIWDIKGQKVVRDLLLSEPVQKFAVVNSDHLVFADPVGQILMLHLDKIESDPQVIYSGGQPFKTLAYNAVHKWLVASSSGTVMIFTIIDPDNLGTFNPEQFTLRHKTVINQMAFSLDNNWLATGSSDAIMLWNMKDIGMKETDKFEPVLIENNRSLYSLSFDGSSKYLFFGDNKYMHICPVDINDIYSRLKQKIGNSRLTDTEWKYYVKGDLARPDRK